MAGATQAGWLVAGLGNPGREYAETRHNVGFAVLDALAAAAGAGFHAGDHQSRVARIDLAGCEVLLVKPQTYMNRSGETVAAWMGALGLGSDRLTVVHDDLDLPLGRLRVVLGAGPGGHRGVASIQEALGTRGFFRVRAGIGRPPEGEGAIHRVLGTFRPEEMAVVGHMIERAAGAVQALLTEGLAPAMNRYNVWVPPEGGPAGPPEQPEERR